MARLSVEHYRANAAMTPENNRKSSRFRSMFKSRSSMSPSTLSTSTDGKFLPQNDSQVLPASPTSPTVKAGFEQVGLLPSERTSLTDAKRKIETHGGHHVAEALERQEKELKGVSVPHNIDTALDGAGVGHQDHTANEALLKSRQEEANVIAEAFQKSLAEHGAESAEHNEKKVSFDDGPSHTLRRTKSRQHLKDVDSTDVFEAGADINHDSTQAPKCPPVAPADNLGHSKVFQPEQNAALPPVQKSYFDKSSAYNFLAGEAGPAFNDQVSNMSNNGMRSFLDEGSDSTDQPSSAHSSLASNIFDRDDPLSQGIREYVDSKIAQATVGLEREYTKMFADQELKYNEALKKQKQKYNDVLKQHRLRPVRVTVNMDMVDSVKAVMLDPTPRGQVFGGSASIINIRIADSYIAFAVQIIVLIGLFALAIATSRLGLTRFISTTLETWMLLRLYKAALIRGNFAHRADDVFVAPMEYLEDLVLESASSTAQFIVQAAAKVLAETPGTVVEVEGDDDTTD